MSGFDKGGMQHQAHGEFFQLCKKYWNPTDEQLKDDGFWNVLVAETNEFSRKYCSDQDRFWAKEVTNLVQRVYDISRKTYPLCSPSDGAYQLIHAMMEYKANQ